MFFVEPQLSSYFGGEIPPNMAGYRGTKARIWNACWSLE